MPQHVPRGNFGPNVAATVTLLSSFGRLSQRMIATLLKDLFDLEISDGQISRLQSQQIQRGTFDNHYRSLRSRILDSLHRGSLCSESKTAETCRRLSNECFSLFVFVHHDCVSPTKNAAEQALRKAVIFRKLSFGTKANTGRKNISVNLSVMETCRRFNRSRLDFIRESIHAAFTNKPAPKLLHAQ
jgi:transposase